MSQSVALQEAALQEEQYKLVHPGLGAYDPGVMDPGLRTGRMRDAVTELAEQIYKFRLFTPEFCRALIDQTERHHRWRINADVLAHPYTDGCNNYCFPDKTVQLDEFPGFATAWDEIVAHHLVPLIAELWPIFALQKINRPYIMKYEPTIVAGMPAHYDLETIALAVYLNDEFEGGGTIFPRWNVGTAREDPGTALIFPGGLSHVHQGLPISSGVRYLLCGAFF